MTKVIVVRTTATVRPRNLHAVKQSEEYANKPFTLSGYQVVIALTKVLKQATHCLNLPDMDRKLTCTTRIQAVWWGHACNVSRDRGFACRPTVPERVLDGLSEMLP